MLLLSHYIDLANSSVDKGCPGIQRKCFPLCGASRHSSLAQFSECLQTMLYFLHTLFPNHFELQQKIPLITSSQS